jgi:Ca2+/H+ antiporter, TMEM165/GDT1 family
MDWPAFLPLFLTAAVEWVEAFTIVLAVSLTIGWAASLGAAAAGLGTLALLTAVTGGALSLGLDLQAIQFVIGVFLLLFGVRWLAKAIARQAGLKALHDEDQEFRETRAKLPKGDWFAAWLVAYKGTLLEGLEVWLVVVAFSLHSQAWISNGIAAITALLAVFIAGLAIRAPLRRVPENAIKFIVGAMIVSFGTFWTLEALAGDVWPLGDWSLLVLATFFMAGGQTLVPIVRRRPQRVPA